MTSSAKCEVLLIAKTYSTCRRQKVYAHKLDSHMHRADLRDFATWRCQHNTCADSLHNFCSRVLKAFQLIKRLLVKRVQGSLNLPDDKLCSLQILDALASQGCDLSLRASAWYQCLSFRHLQCFVMLMV